MMIKPHDDSFTLINFQQWHALSAHATSFYANTFIPEIISFLTEHFELKKHSKVVICCGHSRRFEAAYGFMEHFLASGFSVDCVVPETLWAEFPHKPLYSPAQDMPNAADLMIDLVTDLPSLTLTKTQESWIEKINQFNGPVISLELPSGINPDTGMLYGKMAIESAFTFHSFYHKQGLWTGMAKSFVGQQVLFKHPVVCASNVSLMHEALIEEIRPKRLSYSHKASFKRVIVVAGHHQMQGAAIMAARAALLMGAGLLLMVYPAHDKPDTSHLQEAIWQPIESGYRLIEHVGVDDILVVGPGLGNDKWACEIWQTIKHLDNPIVLDASALHHLAGDVGPHPNWIITPHPGEAGVLLTSDSHQVQKDRFKAARLLKQRFSATVVLKGAGTIVLSNLGQYFVCPLGNPGMATPGMGDILSGLIAGLWAQHLSSEQAAILGVWYHAITADSIALHSLDGVVLASSVLDQIQYGVLGKS